MLQQNSYLTALPRGSKNRKRANQNPLVPMNHPDWKRAYDDVLRETETSKLFKLVEIAEPAILTRLEALVGSPYHHLEGQALKDALHRIKLLKIDRLKFDRI